MFAIRSTWAGAAWLWRRSHWQALRLDQADREWNAGLSAMEAALRAQPNDSPLRSELDNARTDVADKLLRLGLREEAGENSWTESTGGTREAWLKQMATPGTLHAAAAASGRRSSRLPRELHGLFQRVPC